MADRIGLYYKTGGAETGGTNAYTGTISTAPLTRISVADAESAAFAFGALDTVYTLYYRVEDDATFEPSANDTSAAFNNVAPDGISATYTYNTDWNTGAFQLPPAVGAFKPLFVKQTARQTSAEADIIMGYGGVTFTAGTRPTVGTVTPTADISSVALAWSDIAMTGTGYYEVQRATDSGFTANLITLTSTLADGATGYTNNSTNGNAPVNGTTYYYRVRAWDTRGAGAWSESGGVTAGITAYFVDYFDRADSSTVGNSWSQDTANSPSAYGISNNRLFITSGAAQGQFYIHRNLSTANRTLQATLGALPAGAWVIHIQMYAEAGDYNTPTTNDGYMLYADNGGLLYIGKITNGSISWIRQNTGRTYAAGDTIGLQRSGTSYQAYHNGVAVGDPITDATYATLNYSGISLGAAAGTTLSVDNFAVI